jgi:hypothetical protein
MIRFKALNEQNQRDILGLGLTSEDLVPLAKGEPLLVPMEKVGFENSKIDVVIFYGRTLEDLARIHGIPIPPDLVKEATENELRFVRGKTEGGPNGVLPTEGK